MCGITGVLDPNINEKERVITEMNSAILHRGPDDAGIFVDGRVALGMRRLSIIDLAGGHQPITSADGKKIIFFNGEIYNYKELKQGLADKSYQWKTESDTEVILALYQYYGPKMLEMLRGMFAFAIYDIELGKVLIARDFFGIKPLYYLTEGDRTLAFSSEIKSFFQYPGFKPEVNDAAVYNYLSYQYNPLQETFFKNVYKLPPAHFMTVDLDTGTRKVSRYWKFGFKESDQRDEGALKKEVFVTMEDSVKHHMIADVPVGSFLSGGIDSSIIATLMQRIRGDSKIKTFTVGFESLTEGEEAKETSEPLGTDHKEITVGADEYWKSLPKAVWHFDEPVADPSAIGLYFLAREARKHVKVVLSGEGADELFGGYNIYLEPYARRKISWIPSIILKAILKLPFSFKGKNYISRASQSLEERYIGNASIFSKSEAQRIWTGGEQDKFSLKNIYEEAGVQSDSAKMQYVDIHTWLVGDILAKADKMTMAHSLELRVPFLDKKVADLAETLPDKMKWRPPTTKHILREAFKDVLPESVRRRKKLGFPTPIRNWLREDSREVKDTILNSEYIKSRFDTQEIARIIDAHVKGARDNSRKIYLLLMLAIWYNVFIKQQKP